MAFCARRSRIERPSQGQGACQRPVEVHTEGAYYIEWRERGKRCRVSVTREDAVDQARRKAVELRAVRDGLIAAPEPEPEIAPKTKIGDAIDAYLRYVRMQRKPRTHLTYRYTLDTLLRASYKKKYVEDATRDDVLDFMTHCYELGLGARTVYDKVVTVLQLFKKHGRTGLMEKGDWPNYVDTIRPVYEPEELQAMFRAATDDEATLLKFVLGSGFRDQEIRCVEWKDIDFRNHDVRVKAKPHWRFTPKNWEERVVPLPAGLIERLRKRKEARGATPNQLVFPNGRGKPDSEMDMIVKRVAERAKLNCKQCVTEHNNKCAEGPYCMNFFLHKFRHTFATNHLRDGVDIRTVQAWLGHGTSNPRWSTSRASGRRTPHRRSTVASWRLSSPDSISPTSAPIRLHRRRRSTVLMPRMTIHR